MSYRLLALDVDGTLTDPSGAVRVSVAERVRAARDRGLRVVLCTGRRFRTTLPLLEELELDGPVIVHNGVLIKDSTSAETLAHRYLPKEVYGAAIEIIKARHSPLVYVDRYHERLDMLSEPDERAHAFQAEYCADNVDVIGRVERLDDTPPGDVVMLSCMADRDLLESLRTEIEARLGERVRTNFLMNKNYRGHILETVSRDSGKWPALCALAADEGITPDEIVAVGDDNNDVEMVANAGLGIAMGNAVEAVREVADHTTRSNAEDGLARAIEHFLL
jgi:Cof subfamily protein (haloacid dehalogenase superfamily)